MCIALETGQNASQLGRKGGGGGGGGGAALFLDVANSASGGGSGPQKQIVPGSRLFLLSWRRTFRVSFVDKGLEQEGDSSRPATPDHEKVPLESAQLLVNCVQTGPQKSAAVTR